ncbi:glycine betaine/L-proline transporter ProP [Saccharopolyspora sp. K220]|uniref:glycine betaine/L-proline transporter ProP n=1 Tax=Saccharopolyspora soli TaxID=2926618 RepID=UPI001F55D419|nr:glycine betaine/L-proline transporter ProP [Saccharopolyspora soli]MCI2422220.1 glycine betaine/L-proline transporter ProP [Saccharopolyspora soli]
MSAQSDGRSRRRFPSSRRRATLTEDDITVVEAPTLRRAVGATAIGNTMEWFDFGVYSYLAATLGKVFYPEATPTVQLLATFTTFAAAFLVRPLGGLVFGPLGDRFGRRNVLATTMIMMAVATFCLGLIPSYAAIGVWAPALLLVVRMLQGFSTGGEYAGAMTFLSEYSPDRRRGFLGSWLEFGTLTGYVLGAGLVTAITSALPEQDVVGWAWRIPFLVAGPLGLIGLYLRLRLEETPAYSRMASSREDERGGEFRTIIVRWWRAMLLCIGLVLAFNVTNYMLTSYMPTYLSSVLGYRESHGLLLVLVVMVAMMVAITFVGRLSDRVGRRPVVLVGCGLLVVFAVPSFLLVQMGGVLPVFAGVALQGLMLLCFNSTLPSTLPALFPTRVRYGGLSIAFNISVALFGGTTPLVSEALIAETGSKIIPAVLLVVAGLVGGVAMWFTHESAGKPMPGSGPTVSSRQEAKELAARSR